MDNPVFRLGSPKATVEPALGSNDNRKPEPAPAKVKLRLKLWRVEKVCAKADISVGYFRKLAAQNRTPPYADERHSHVFKHEAKAWLKMHRGRS